MKAMASRIYITPFHTAEGTSPSSLLPLDFRGHVCAVIAIPISMLTEVVTIVIGTHNAA